MLSLAKYTCQAFSSRVRNAASSSSRTRWSRPARAAAFRCRLTLARHFAEQPTFWRPSSGPPHPIQSARADSSRSRGAEAALGMVRPVSVAWRGGVQPDAADEVWGTPGRAGSPPDAARPPSTSRAASSEKASCRGPGLRRIRLRRSAVGPVGSRDLRVQGAALLSGLTARAPEPGQFRGHLTIGPSDPATDDGLEPLASLVGAHRAACASRRAFTARGPRGSVVSASNSSQVPMWGRRPTMSRCERKYQRPGPLRMNPQEPSHFTTWPSTPAPRTPPSPARAGLAQSRGSLRRGGRAALGTR